MYYYFCSSGPVPVSAPVSMAHDFNHSLAPSVEDPILQGMSEPSLYGLQPHSTIAGDPHCFSGSTSSTVPPLLGTPGYLSSHGMMELSMYSYVWIANAKYNCRRRATKWFLHDYSHPPSRNPGISFPAWNAKFFTTQPCRVDVQLYKVNTHKIRTVLPTNLGQVHNRQHYDIYKFLMVIV